MNLLPTLVVLLLPSAVLAQAADAGKAPAPAASSPAAQDAALPAAVSTALAEFFPGAKVKAVKQEEEDGQPVYNFDLDLAGKKLGIYEVEISPSGKVIEFKERCGAEGLPEKVQALLEERFPQAKYGTIDKKTKGTKDAGRIEYLRLSLTFPGGKASADFGDGGSLAGLTCEEKVETAAIPGSITKALETRYPDAEVQTAAKCTKGSGQKEEVSYSLGVRIDREERNLVYEADGTLLLEKLTKRAAG
jgi:hypothetical protein